MGLFDELKDLGVNIEEGKKRLMGNESLYERMLGTFVKMMSDTPIEPSEFDCDDCTEIIEKTHAIKGASGNLSLTPVYEAYSKMVDLLRQNKPAEAKAIYEEIQPVQTEIIRCIEKYK